MSPVCVHQFLQLQLLSALLTWALSGDTGPIWRFSPTQLYMSAYLWGRSGALHTSFSDPCLTAVCLSWICNRSHLGKRLRFRCGGRQTEWVQARWAVTDRPPPSTLALSASDLWPSPTLLPGPLPPIPGHGAVRQRVSLSLGPWCLPTSCSTGHGRPLVGSFCQAHCQMSVEAFFFFLLNFYATTTTTLIL